MTTTQQIGWPVVDYGDGETSARYLANSDPERAKALTFEQITAARSMGPAPRAAYFADLCGYKAPALPEQPAAAVKETKPMAWRQPAVIEAVKLIGALVEQGRTLAEIESDPTVEAFAASRRRPVADVLEKVKAEGVRLPGSEPAPSPFRPEVQEKIAAHDERLAEAATKAAAVTTDMAAKGCHLANATAYRNPAIASPAQLERAEAAAPSYMSEAERTAAELLGTLPIGDNVDEALTATAEPTGDGPEIDWLAGLDETPDPFTLVRNAAIPVAAGLGFDVSVAEDVARCMLAKYGDTEAAKMAEALAADGDVFYGEWKRMTDAEIDEAFNGDSVATEPAPELVGTSEAFRLADEANKELGYNDLLKDVADSVAAATPAAADVSSETQSGYTWEQFVADCGDEPPAREPFMIDTLDRLAWYGRKLTGFDAEVAELTASFNKMLDAIGRRRAGFERWFGPQAETFAAEELARQGGKGKTLQTLGGAFAFRTVPGGIKRVDPAEVLAWAEQQHPELVHVETKRTVPADRIKGHWQTTGEIPPGCELTEDRQTFSHKPAKKETE